MRSYFFRPWLLLALSAAVVVGALVVVFQRPPPQGRPTPLPIAGGEREIVWLYPATNATSWERFVTAVRRTAERWQRRHPDWQADYHAAFPRQTTVVPQVSLSWGGAGQRFHFRWYKLTNDWKTRDWVEALLKRQPPPLAIIGGGSSDSARELATHLDHYARELPAEDRPLLLLTTATADRVAPFTEGEPVWPSRSATRKDGVQLTSLYPGRTFRFCFTNKQMAAAVSDFIWSRADLRPDRDPLYMAMWNDDSYSRDLIDGFGGALRQVMARDAVNQCLWMTNQLLFNFPLGASGGIFPVQRQALDDDPLSASTFWLAEPPTLHVIDSSVGSFDTPNRYEAKAAGEMLDVLMAKARSRSLLIVAGQSQPSRRFLRGLIRGVPSLAKQIQYIVATGDAVSFNTVYRDRQVAWNIQDLPFPLVFFCHRNPIDAEAGFRAGTVEGDGVARVGQASRFFSHPPPSTLHDGDSTAETGTEDVLLFGDIVEALLQTGAPAEGTPCAHAAELASRLAEARLQDDRIVLGGPGVALFNAEGQRQSGTGEHVVYLQPIWAEERLLPSAAIEVWAWQRRDWNRGERGQRWQRRGALNVSYSDTPMEGSGEHGGP